MKIITGRTGEPHVTSFDFRQIIEGIVGQGSYIFQYGDNLETELVSNNLLKIKSGVMVHHGNISSVENYDEIELANGTQGMWRIDLVVARYVKDAEANTETTDWVVIQGTPAASNPEVPSYTVGNMQESDLVDDCPVFKITYNGIDVVAVDRLLSVSKSIDDLSNIVRRKTLFNYPSGYINSDGVSLPMLLSDVIENYDYIELFYGTDIGGHSCPQQSIKLPTDVLEEDKYMLFSMYTASLNKEESKYFQIMMTRLRLEKGSLTGKFESSREINFSKTAGSVKWEMSTTMHHRVYRIVGYKIGF